MRLKLTRRDTCISCLAGGVATLLRAAGAKAQPTQLQVFDRLETALGTLVARAPDFGPEWAAQVRRIGEMLHELEDRYSGTQLGQDYLVTLSANAIILERAAAQPGTPSALAALQFTASDLSAKVASARSSLGLQGQRGGNLDVRVTAARNGNPVAGLLVRANLAGDPGAEPPFMAFDAPTPVAQASMPPGLYVIIVRRSDQEALLARQYASIAGRGGQVVHVTVVVP